MILEPALRPWRLEWRDPLDERPLILSAGIDADTVCRAFREDADLIVRAVNAFDAMRGALKGALIALEDGEDCLATAHAGICPICGAKKEIEAALALADGGQ